MSLTRFQVDRTARLHAVTQEARCLPLCCCSGPDGFPIVSLPEAELPPSLNSSQQEGEGVRRVRDLCRHVVPDSEKALMSSFTLHRREFSPEATPPCKEGWKGQEEGSCGSDSQLSSPPLSHSCHKCWTRPQRKRDSAVWQPRLQGPGGRTGPLRVWQPRGHASNTLMWGFSS